MDEATKKGLLSGKEREIKRTSDREKGGESEKK